MVEKIIQKNFANIKKDISFALLNTQKEVDNSINTDRIMNTNTTLTIEQLAEKLNGKLWVKGDLKRIYLDCGYNTKKMSTKTYVFQREDGSFGVSCYIECPSQPYAWVKSQQDEVIEGVERSIEIAHSNTVYIMTNCEGIIVGSDSKPRELNYATEFFTEKEAKEELDNCSSFHSYTTMDRNEFEAEVERLDAIDQEKRIQYAIDNPKESPSIILVSTPAKTINTDTPDYAVGSKVNHAKFGIGEVVAESDSIIEIKFESLPEVKKLMKAFAKLEKL